jgi:hypothetical protein
MVNILGIFQLYVQLLFSVDEPDMAFKFMTGMEKSVVWPEMSDDEHHKLDHTSRSAAELQAIADGKFQKFDPIRRGTNLCSKEKMIFRIVPLSDD